MQKLDQRLAELSQKTGQPDTDTASAADRLAKVLQGADQQAAEAQKRMNESGDPSQTAASLASAAQTLAGAMGDAVESAQEPAGSSGDPIADATQQAMQSLQQASSAARASDGRGAQASTQAAREAIASAQQALQQAMASSKSSPSQGKPGRADRAMPGPTQGDPSDGLRAADAAAGPHRAVDGPASTAALPPRDRDALRQSRSDAYSPDYADAIEQYLRSLATGDEAAPAEKR
ncbi:MAG: hypothetical protein QM770_11520 [Tepidisphaeraceae bacterium]